MKSNNLKPFEGEKYRTGGAAGVHTLFIVYSLCALLIWYCASFSLCMEYGAFELGPDLILWMFIIIVGGAFATYVFVLIGTLILNNKTFIELDKDGIRGRGKAGSFSYDEFSYKWDEISSISFVLNRIIIRKGEQSYTHTLSFVFRRNAKFLLALHTFGGERLLSEQKINKIQRIHRLILVAIFALGFIYTIGILGYNYCQPFSYTMHDFTVVGDDTYAVGSMCQSSSVTDRPVVWKNGEIQEIGPVGNFNTAVLICEMGGDIYIVSRVGEGHILLKNNEPFIHLYRCQRSVWYQSMIAVDDTLYISELNDDTEIGKYRRKDIIGVYKYVKGNTDIQRVPKEDISQDLFEQITTHVVMSERMFYRSIPEGKNSTMETPRSYYMKVSGNEIYLLGQGPSNVRCRNKSKVDLSIWRYVEQEDTYSFERVYE